MSEGVASWGVLGVALLLCRALYQLAPLALEPIVSSSLTVPHWILLLAWVAFNAYAEGSSPTSVPPFRGSSRSRKDDVENRFHFKVNFPYGFQRCHG